MNFRIKDLVVYLSFTAISVGSVFAQTTNNLNSNATLDELIQYALENKIEIRQAQIDQEIGEREIASALSGWFPQINANGSLTHFMQLPTANINGQNIAMGQRNTSALTFQADQAIINPGLFQASKAAKYIRQQNDLSVEDTKINTVVDVSKAYYDILTSEEQINIIQENISRLNRQYTEANARYETGLVDKTDYKRAQISLNNAKAELKTALEFRKYKYDYLKTLLGMNPTNGLTLSFENQNMESNVLMDTTDVLNYNNRVELRQLQTMKDIQKLNTQYQKWQFLPRLGAFANYGLNYRNNSFSDLYGDNFPQSSFGLSLTFPIFQGGKRVQEIKRSELLESRIDMDIENLENQIGAQYSAAMANYRANINEWRNAKENVELSEEVYNTIKLQYDAGVKTYLELMTAETDLKTSQLNYLNSLYAVLSSKLDIQKALGTVNFAN
ncbi:transporter [Sphingobacterium mizutaii NBRC 14946 = DSM 11724]|uniref:Outer membrane protein tolC n=2 Tax=Sphingobacterium mizutaii TaxID=1010 RepID=A0AAJ4X9W5_9SPHI|nr:TolC family protein [Sphingobacterium mizutaii]GEM70051.1 transporter [Sphingobacterium mizutaii NBRC 14946 = DSM 11724]SDL43200.1 Outer membrane protein TolC [Sphingobacterium mizutaii]SNV45403.1 Outer membrane protein tolC precursor [Sphingobacterium mizutaii]